VVTGPTYLEIYPPFLKRTIKSFGKFIKVDRLLFILIWILGLFLVAHLSVFRLLGSRSQDLDCLVPLRWVGVHIDSGIFGQSNHFNVISCVYRMEAVGVALLQKKNDGAAVAKNPIF